MSADDLLRLERMKQLAEQAYRNFEHRKHAVRECKRREEEWLMRAGRCDMMRERAEYHGYWNLASEWSMLVMEAYEAANLEDQQRFQLDEQLDQAELAYLIMSDEVKEAEEAIQATPATTIPLFQPD